MTFKRTSGGVLEWSIECDRIGLVTIDDPISTDLNNAMILQNIRTRDGVLALRSGSRFVSAFAFAGRCAGLHQAYPSDGEAADRLYVSCKNQMHRFSGVVPTLTENIMTFPTGLEWSPNTRRTRFIDWNSLVFAFNGIDYGMTLRNDSLNDMYAFMLTKPGAPTTAISGAGAITGTFRYKVRYVREVSADIREYWGAMSNASTKQIAATQNITVTYAVPTDPQVNAVYLYRTADDGGSFFFHARIVGPFTGTYLDSINATDETRIDPDVIDRIHGAKWACKHNGILVLFGDADEDNTIYWSNPMYPQEFDPYNGAEFTDGHGRSIGAAAVNNSVVLFKQSGMAYYRLNSALAYDQVAFFPAFGCCAPWSIKEVSIANASFITFWDPREGLCICDGVNPPRSLKTTKTGSDIINIIKSGIKKAALEDISIEVYDHYIVCSYNSADSSTSYNDRAVVYDMEKEVWVGPDRGYSAGPMITRDINYGVSGQGEMFYCLDSAAPRLMQLFDASSTKDAIVAAPGTANIEYWWLSGKIGSKMVNELIEFTQISMVAKLGGPITVSCETYNTITALGTVDNMTSNVGIFDVSQFDDGSVFGDFNFYSYTVGFDETNQGFWTQIQIKDSSDNYIGISGLKLFGMGRGYF